MKIEVYGDIAFLINFCMDYILLTFMCRILSCKSTAMRRALAAAFGGAGALCAFYVPSALGVPMQICLGVLMCITAAPCTHPRVLLTRAAVFFGSAFVFGGGTLALLCASGANVLVKSGAFYIDMNVKVLIFSSIICALFLECARLLAKRAGVRLKRSVTVSFMGRMAVLRGYIDTGNTLTSGGLPVILTHWEAVSGLFSEDSTAHDFMLKCPHERIRPVTYRAVDGGGVVWCIEPDEVLIDGKRCGALVGVCNYPMSEEYDALLNYNLTCG